MKYAFKMLTITSMLNLPGENLLMRSFGKKAKGIIEEKLVQMQEGSSLYLDFLGVTLTDVSFVDEAILALQKEIGNGVYGDRRIVVTNMNEVIIENLEAAIYLRKEKYKQKILILFLANKDMHVLGRLEKTLYDAFVELAKVENMSARQLAQVKDIEINTASNRLKKLFDYGLVHRDEVIDSEGRSHLYRLPS